MSQLWSSRSRGCPSCSGRRSTAGTTAEGQIHARGRQAVGGDGDQVWAVKAALAFSISNESSWTTSSVLAELAQVGRVGGQGGMIGADRGADVGHEVGEHGGPGGIGDRRELQAGLCWPSPSAGCRRRSAMLKSRFCPTAAVVWKAIWTAALARPQDARGTVAADAEELDRVAAERPIWCQAPAGRWWQSARARAPGRRCCPG